MLYSTLQMLEPVAANTLASMKAPDPWHGDIELQLPLEL
jgi:hypothetical protein